MFNNKLSTKKYKNKNREKEVAWSCVMKMIMMIDGDDRDDRMKMRRVGYEDGMWRGV